MKTRIFITLLTLGALTGCYGNMNMRLYPVKGPLIEQTPLPVFTGEFSGVYDGGEISVNLPNGEVCKGEWARVKPAAGSAGETITNAFRADGMSSVWDSVYGPGFYVSHVVGREYYGASRVTGDHGSVLDVEFLYGGEHEETRRGVARDNKQNIYKVVF